jgi:predicted nuclease of predicted toxin-antitoxin system
MKILIDMNLPLEWVTTLQNAGFEASHWSTVGDARATDRTIMNWAVTNGYIVFTHDLDFGTLLAISQADAPSVIQVRVQDVLPANIGNLVVNALNQFKTELESGALITIDVARTRAKILPIQKQA